VSKAERVREYFDRVAERFDGIYSEDQVSVAHRMVDRLFRRAYLQRRLELSVLHCAGADSVLDVGCGSGRGATEIARRLNISVVGIDFSERMIQKASQLAAAKGVASLCSFLQEDFLNTGGEKQFGALVAIGLFDYVDDPCRFLSKMHTVAPKVIASFPARNSLLFPARSAWLFLKRCPVHFYTRGQIRKLLDSSGFDITFLEAIGYPGLKGDYLVVGEKKLSQG
jgi:2-polyprenyl-3-methyl-5-hydroxy-6-metoxy-1,4-benzoquinol methylase